MKKHLKPFLSTISILFFFLSATYCQDSLNVLFEYKLKNYDKGNNTGEILTVQNKELRRIEYHESERFEIHYRVLYCLIQLDYFIQADDCERANKYYSNLNKLEQICDQEDNIKLSIYNFKNIRDNLVIKRFNGCITPPLPKKSTKDKCPPVYWECLSNDKSKTIKVTLHKCSHLEVEPEGFRKGVFTGLESYYKEVAIFFKVIIINEFGVHKEDINVWISGHADSTRILNKIEGIRIKDVNDKNMVLIREDYKNMSNTENYEHQHNTENRKIIHFPEDLGTIRTNQELALVRAYFALLELFDITNDEITVVAHTHDSNNKLDRKVEIVIDFPNDSINDQNLFDTMCEKINGN